MCSVRDMVCVCVLTFRRTQLEGCHFFGPHSRSLPTVAPVHCCHWHYIVVKVSFDTSSIPIPKGMASFRIIIYLENGSFRAKAPIHRKTDASASADDDIIFFMALYLSRMTFYVNWTTLLWIWRHVPRTFTLTSFYIILVDVLLKFFFFFFNFPTVFVKKLFDKKFNTFAVIKGGRSGNFRWKIIKVGPGYIASPPHAKLHSIAFALQLGQVLLLTYDRFSI